MLSPMYIKTRTATADDAKRIAEIFLASRKEHVRHAPLAHADEAVRSWITEQLVPAGTVSVILADDRIQGFLAISRGESHGWIDHIYLDPSAVGMGLGTLLLEQAKQLLGSPIRLYTFQESKGARRFYRRHGFREVEFSDGTSNEEKAPDVLMEWP